MSASAHVGRIGGLALSLGIGIAVAGMGTATASPGDASPRGDAHPSAAKATASAENHRASSPHRTPNLSGAGRESAGLRSASDRRAIELDLPAAPSADSTKTASDTAGLGIDFISQTPVPAPAAAATDRASLVLDRLRESGAPTSAAAEPTAMPTDAAMNPVNAVPAAKPPTMIAADAGSAAVAFHEEATGPDPAAPLQSALSWSMLAAARRELNEIPAGAAAVAIPAAAVPLPAASVDSFVSQWRGRTVGSGECVALIVQYLRDVYGLPNPGGNAIDFAPRDLYPAGASGLRYSNNAGAGVAMYNNGFTFYTGAPSQNGDILVWKESSTSQIGAYGHVGLWYNGQVFDQNDGRGAHVGSGGTGVRTANYSGGLFTGGYLGYWRKGTSAADLSEGSFVRVSDGNGEVYRIAGGAPIYVSNWDNVGGVKPVTAISQSQFNQLRSVPADGTAIRDTVSGDIYIVAGGAPTMATYSWWNSGNSRPYVDIDPEAINNAGGGGRWSHLNYKPADGTAIKDTNGSVYVTAGGAPIYVSNWDNVGGVRPTTDVDIAAIENAGGGGRWSHLNYKPADGTYLRGFTTGKVYTVNGGTPTLVSSAPGAYVTIDQSAIDNAGAGGVWNHLNPLAQPNRAPVISRVDVGTPNASTGVVTGTVAATDPDGNSLTYSAPSTTKGAVSVNASTGAFTYTPTAAARQNAASGSAADKQDSFTITVTDTSGATVNAAVTVGVAAPAAKPNQAPVVTAVEVAEPNDLTGIVLGYVTGSDPDNNELTYSVPTATSKGAVSINISAGTFTYTPTAAARHAVLTQGTQTGTDSFSVTISDGHGGSVTAPVTVTISSNNNAPTATASAGEPDPSSGVVIGTITGSDPDDDAMTISTPSSTGKGTVRLNDDGSFTYTPTTAARQKAATGSAADRADRFTITISDAYGASSTTTVDVTVLGATGGSTNGGPDNGGGSIDTGITDLNATIGWIPIVGTIYNAFMLVNDLIQTVTALAVGDTFGLGLRFSLIVIDLIGMIPIIGGPIAASLYQALPYPAAATPAASVGL